MRGDMLDGTGGEYADLGDPLCGSMFSPQQVTLKSPIPCSGTGLHSGSVVNMVIRPAPADHGIVFFRTDITDQNPYIPARFDQISATKLCSTVSNEDGVSVATIEHLMAALSALGVDNALIELDAPEVPVMDGSSEPFVFLIDCAGVVEMDAPRMAIRILKPVTVEDGQSRATLSPGNGYTIDMAIEFTSEVIGRQWMRTEVSPALFRSTISRARTFGFRHEVEGLRAMGLALGGSLDNAVVVDGNDIMNQDGLRYDDEFVRHKVLDCIGDLALAGYQIVGTVSAERTGHALNNKLLHALFADPSAYEIITVSEAHEALAFLSAAE